MRIIEDAVWRYYNCPDPFWSAKCRSCREKIAALGVPVEECLNCWKVEIWSSCQSVRDAVIDGLIVKGIPVIAKASRAPIFVVRSGVPVGAYTSETVNYLLILYARDIAERDLLRREAEAVLSESIAPEHFLPVRRGCWKYDDALGPWQAWCPPDKDYRES